MSDILDEVVRESNDEKKMLYFKKALPIVAIITVVIVIGMIINNYLNSRAEKHSIEIGDTLIKSMENIRSEPQLTLEGLEYVISNAKNNEKDIAALQLLAIHLASKNLDTALNVIDKIVESKNHLPLTTAYAKLMWISIMVENKDISEEDNAKLNKYFDAFKENTPFYGSANLLKAMWYKDKDSEQAIVILQKLISNKEVTSIIKEEAKSLISNLKSKN